MRTKLYAASLLLAPLFYAISSFFWQGNGQYSGYSVTSGTLIIIGSVFWVIAFSALFDALKEKTPGYASIGLLFAVYGCLCGGVAFALRDIFTSVFNISHHDMLVALSQHPVLTDIVFWAGGPAFPLSLLILGIVLTSTKTVELWVGISIALAGVLFPLSRIPRIELIAHIADAFMLIPLANLSWQLFSQDGLNKQLVAN